MKTLILTFTFGAFFCGAAWAQNIPERRQHQHQRIREGVESGELTKGEAARLRRQQESIENQIRRDRRDGVGMTAAERARAQKRLNHASRDIRRMKNNGRNR